MDWTGGYVTDILYTYGYYSELNPLNARFLCLVNGIACRKEFKNACELGFGIKVSQDVYSSDSTPFADRGIPAVSFARIAPNNTATIHNSYDTMAVMSGEQMVLDMDFITAFASRMANARQCPVAREMPENMKEKLDIYLCRKRDKK